MGVVRGRARPKWMTAGGCGHDPANPPGRRLRNNMTLTPKRPSGGWLGAEVGDSAAAMQQRHRRLAEQEGLSDPAGILGLWG
jgi:hypothetical protein